MRSLPFCGACSTRAMCRRATFPLLDRGRRERLFFIASGWVVDKLRLAQRSLLRCLIYHPVCASKEGGLSLYGAATPPVQEGKFAGRYIFLRMTTVYTSSQNR